MTSAPPSRSAYVRRQYEDPRVAAGYERERTREVRQRVRAWLERRMLRRALGLVPAGGTLLDVACGTGRLAPVLAPFARRLTGVDASPAMLGAARAHGRPGVGLVAGDAAALPFADASFDTVVTSRFVRHLDSPGRVAVFRELRRVARRHVVVEVLLSSGLDWRTKVLLHGRAWREEIRPRRPSPAELLSELTAAGLHIIARIPQLRGFSMQQVYLCRV